MKRKSDRRAVIGILLFIGLVAAIFYQKQPDSGPYAATLPILSYHAIRTIHDAPLGMTVIDYDRFAEQMRYLHEQGYTTLSMDEVVQFMRGKKFPQKIVAINFDDGLVSSLQAVPLLLRYGFKASFWVIPGVAQPDPLKPGADRSYMSWSTLKLLDMAPGITLYSHTMTHPWEKGNSLTDWAAGHTPGKTINDARLELTESKLLLEENLGHPVPYLNWPAGTYDQTLVDLARQSGYTAAVTADDGLNQPGGDLFHIQRIKVNGNCDAKMFELMLTDGIYRACEG